MKDLTIQCRFIEPVYIKIFNIDGKEGVADRPEILEAKMAYSSINNIPLKYVLTDYIEREDSFMDVIRMYVKSNKFLTYKQD